MRKIYTLSAAFAMLFTACSYNGFFGDPTTTQTRDVVIQKIDKDDLRDVIKKEKMVADAEPAEISFSAVGEGIAPQNTISHAHALILARKAAIADAYSKLAGKLYGVKVNAEDTVRDAMLRDSSVNTKVQGLVKNASVVKDEFNNGLYRVEMRLSIDQDKWQEIFSY